MRKVRNILEITNKGAGTFTLKNIVLKGLLQDNKDSGGVQLIPLSVTPGSEFGTIFDNVQFLEIKGGCLPVGSRNTTKVENCLFKYNSAGNGAALSLSYASTVNINNCSFISNQGTAAGWHGGAIAAEREAQVTLNVNKSYFKGNVAPDSAKQGTFGSAGGLGGGISLYRCENSSLTVDHCVFEENKTRSSTRITEDGGAISIKNNFDKTQALGEKTTFSIINTSFIDNKADDDGAALLIEGRPINDSKEINVIGTVENCTFVGNEGSGTSGAGGAVQVYGFGASAAFTSCTFFGNSKNNANSGGGAIGNGSSGKVSLTNNLFVGNTYKNTSNYMKNRHNVYISGTGALTDNGGNVGLDNGTELPAGLTVASVFGTETPVLGNNGSNGTAGAIGNSVPIKTLYIAPNLHEDDVFYADGAGTTGDPTLDQRGLNRGAGTGRPGQESVDNHPTPVDYTTALPDAGAVDINTTLFDANGGTWLNITAYSYGSPTVYNADATKAGIATDHIGSSPITKVGALQEPETAPADTPIFVEWNTKQDGSGTKYAPGDEVPVGYTYYAIWKAPTYTVTYHGNSNTGGTSPVDSGSPYQVGSSVTVLDQADLVKDGYKFLGWSESEDATAPDQDYTPGKEFTISKDTDLYAVWQQIPTYTVTYHGNGNTGGTAPVDSGSPYQDGSSVTVLGKANLVKDGYKFLGWSEREDATAPDNNFAPGKTFTISKDTELYAVWQQIPTYTVNYHGNGNTGGTAPVDSGSPYQDGSSVTVLGKANLVKDGYKFLGWSEREDATAPDDNFAPGKTFTISKDTELYAVWQQIPTYTVTYHGNSNTGGTVPVDSESPYQDGSTVTVLGKADLIKDGYKFLGWSESEDATAPDDNFAPGKTFTISKDTDLYAVWQQIPTYKVNYHGNGNTGGTAPVDSGSPYQDGSTVTVLGKANLVKDRYKFLGWSESEDATAPDDNFAPGKTFTISKDTDLYAVWQQIPTYTVTYHGNSNTGGAAPVDSESPYQDGSTVTVLGNAALIKVGYKFLGWSESEDATAPDDNFEPGKTFTISKETDLYAVWQQIPTYTVNYHGNGNTGGTAPVDSESPYQDGSTVTVLGKADLIKDGYKFLGWSESEDATAPDEAYNPSEEFTISKDTDLYAVWQQIPTYTVTYHGNGNTGGITPVDSESPYQDGSTVTVLEKGSLIKEGYVFLGWSEDPDAAEADSLYTPSAQFIISRSIELYAVWQKGSAETYTVTYLPNGGTGGYTDTGLAYQSDYTVLSNQRAGINRPGYTFKGWNISADGKGVNYSADAKMVITGDVTLYAQWKANPSTPSVSNSPSTGDNTFIGLWIAIATLSLSALTGIIVLSKKKQG